MNLKRSEFLALMAAATAVTAIAIDAMLPALGDVRTHFGLGDNPADSALIVSIFILGLGIGQIIYGPLSDRYGRKPILALGLTIYIVAGMATTFAPTFELLLLGRFIWGLGSAGPRIVAQAILRDRFSGDALARAMAIMFAIFLVVPTVAPLIGQLVLNLGSWRYTFAVGPVFAVGVFLWTTRLEETLPPEARRSIAPRELAAAISTVFKTPTALGNMIALTALSAAFLPYLASSERIYSLIYDRGGQFFFWFSLNAGILALFTLSSGWIVGRLGSDRTAKLLLTSLFVASATYLAITMVSDGVPGFFVFYLMTTVVVGLGAGARPMLTSQALDDVGHIAGTAASLIGAVTLAGGSILSRFIDEAIDDTITPFVSGFLIASVIAIAANTWARSRRPVEV